MDADRLNKLKLKAELATSLAEQIEKLTEAQHEHDSNKLDYVTRCEIYRRGREALLKQKEAELEGLLTEKKKEDQQPVAVVSQPSPMGDPYTMPPQEWTDPQVKPFAEISCAN